MKIVTFGEIMLRLSTPGFARFSQAKNFNATYGGGEANVAMSLSLMGFEAEHITRFPDNDLGKAATQMLQQYGLKTENIVFGGDRLGIYFLETGAISRPSKVVYDRAGSSFSSLNPKDFNWDKILEGADWFHFTGISPAISQEAANACHDALDAANAKGVKVSFDVTYRKNLWQYGKTPQEVLTELAAKSDLLFCSKGDLKEILSIQANEEDKFAQVCQRTMARFPRVKTIVNSKRESNSASDNTISGVLFNGVESFSSQKHRLTHIVDRIGGGDAFCAGLIYGLLVYKDEQKAIECATAASAVKHSIEGDFNQATVEEIETLMRGDGSGKLSR
jgi:2-dehydro-3-deoxygluconokinase